MTPLIREPLAHFIVLGALLFAIDLWRSSGKDDVSRPPIEISTPQIEWICAAYNRQFNRDPDADELRGLVQDHIREEVLYREALALGLDRDDSIVRRRMAQKMEFLTADIVNATEPSEAALQTYFQQHTARYESAPRLTFRHVYFSERKHGNEAKQKARSALAELQAGADPERVGDAFLAGFDFDGMDSAQIDAVFGAGFADQFSTSSTGTWSGPISSSYGAHLVWFESQSAPEPASFDAVREQVARDWKEVRRREANEASYETLRAGYQIRIDEAAIKRAAPHMIKTAGQDH